MKHSQSSPVEKGVILIAHGSRLQKTADEMLALVESLQKKLTDTVVEPAFMELQKPDLKTAINSLVEKGIHKISIIPLFFFTGRHMRDDIPDQVEECRKLYKECELDLRPCFGLSDEFMEALVKSALAL